MIKGKKDNVDEIIADVKSYLEEEETASPEENYSEWLYQQGKQEEEPAVPAPKKRKKKKRKVWKWLLGLLLAFLAFCLAMWFIFAKQPVAEESLGERKVGASTILLAGTDAGGMRSDTMMLLHVDQAEGSISLVSLPRDTYVSGYSVPKLNSAIGAGGMDELMDRVTELIGYRPDGYVLVDLEGFVSVVDAVGGIEFDVPQDMYYDDPVQDLHIALQAGPQKLKGTDAMGLVRYRSGYAQADLRRVEVQRDFIKAAMNQIISTKNIAKAPQLLTIVMANTETDMGMDNFVWLAKALLVCDKENIRMETMPGYTKTINGGSYFVVDNAQAAALLNECCNPYEIELTAEDLG